MKNSNAWQNTLNGRSVLAISAMLLLGTQAPIVLAEQITIDTNTLLINGTTSLNGASFIALRRSDTVAEFLFRDNLVIRPGDVVAAIGPYGVVLHSARDVTIGAGVSFQLSASGQDAGAGGGRGANASAGGNPALSGGTGGSGGPGGAGADDNFPNLYIAARNGGAGSTGTSGSMGGAAPQGNAGEAGKGAPASGGAGGRGGPGGPPGTNNGAGGGGGTGCSLGCEGGAGANGNHGGAGSAGGPGGGWIWRH